jgi:hypothetical protein
MTSSISYTVPYCNEDIPKTLTSFNNKNKKMTGFKNIRIDSTIMLPKPQGFMKLPPPNPSLMLLIAYNNNKKTKSKSTLIIYKTISRKGLPETEDPLSSIRSYYPFLQHFLVFILIAIIFYYRNTKIKNNSKNDRYNRSKFMKDKGRSLSSNKHVSDILKNIDNDRRFTDDLGNKRLERLLAEVSKLSSEVDTTSKNKPQTIH